MARTPRFKVVQTEKGWRVNVPQSLSETGKRQQQFYPTREKANEFAKGLRDAFKEFGSQARNLSPGDTEDATKALELLKGYEANLTACARFYITHHDRRGRAPTMGDAMEAGIEIRKDLSTRYHQSLKNVKKRLPADFAAKNIVDLAPSDISIALSEMTDGATAWKNALRMFSAVLGDYVTEGTLHENPCARVALPKTKKNDEVTIYTVEQLKSLFGACRDYKDGTDPKCRTCAVPFAFLAFAGIRPTELTRLRWDEVNMTNGYIRIGGGISKMGKTRNVRINKTLKAWIAILPESERVGKIVPGRWRQKSTRVRKEAGLDGRELQDALRHSYGSYMLAVETDDSALKADMGHQHWDVFFNHYHNATTPEQAAPYWKILPEA
jgi:integrase/recombinase XerD